MPRFLDAMLGINWAYWLSDQRVAMPWLPPPLPRYIDCPPIAVLLATTACMTAAAAFAAWCWARWRGPVVL